jgi:hypothetical protein
LTYQIIDQHLGVDFLLDVKWRHVDHQIGPVLLFLAAPNQLPIEIGVSRVSYRHGLPLVVLLHRLIFDRRNVLPLIGIVRDCSTALTEPGFFLAMVIS